MSRGLLISAVVVALVAGAAFATPTVVYTVTLEATYSGAGNLDNAQDNVPDGTLASTLSAAAGTIYQLDVSAAISGLAAGENFANLNASVTLSSPDLSFVDIQGTAKNDLADTFLFQTPAGNNYKIGTTTIYNNDEVVGTGATESLFVSDTAAIAKSKNPGVGTNPLDIGQLYLAWDGSGTPTVTIAGNTFQVGYNLSTWEGNSSGSGTAQAWAPGGYPVTGASQAFGTPEPATMALLLVGGIGALLRRRK